MTVRARHLAAMVKTGTTSDLPHACPCDTAPQVFESAAARSVDLGSEPPGEALTSLEARLVEARGGSVRLGRHEVIRRIGVGGMGVVYEAVDRDHGHRVALKTLRTLNGPGLYRFKHEFRALATIAHPNLVVLHELYAEEGEWFFTMEHVDGAGFADHAHGDASRAGVPYLGETVHLDEPSISGAWRGERSGRISAARERRGGGGPPIVIDGIACATDAPILDMGGTIAGAKSSRRRASFREDALRAALRGLAEGVAALHSFGLVHRDLNSSNVLVTSEGRVVVLDFGLVAESPCRRAGTTPFDGLSGTPGYMSPEQAAGKAATPASDWYAFGVMLFEALTGQLPFRGGSMRMLAAKQAYEAPLPSSIASGVPRDLDELCRDLLRRRADERPDGGEVRRRLGVPGARPLRAGRQEPGLVARRGELSALEAALRAGQSGRAAVARVEGAPGTGKTVLCERFVATAAARDHAVVLRGSAAARERISHRALDGIVDALAVHLAALPDRKVRMLLPPGVRALASLFPVLEAVPGVAEITAPRVGAEETEAAAFAALAEIIRRLASARPVIVWIDDLDQATPADLAHLDALLGATLVLLSGEPLPGAVDHLPTLDSARRLRLEPLSPASARAHAREALRVAGADPAPADRVAQASDGNPRLVNDLARLLADDDASEVSIEAMLEARIADMPAAAGLLLEVLAAARGPVPLSLALRVARLGEAPRAPAIDVASLVVRLSAAGLVRARGLGAADPIEIADPHVQAAASARISAPVMAQIHLDLAAALARWPGVDAAEIAEQLHLGGERQAAIDRVLTGADHAFAARDFDRAARLFGRALAWSPREPGVAVRRAEALAAAGRGAEAARAFLGAVAEAERVRAPPDEILDLRRQAAEHMLLAGRVDEGLGLLRPVLAAVGLREPASPRLALLRLVARLLKLAISDGGARPHLRASQRIRAEVAWTAGRGLAAIDPVRASLFVVEALLAARAAGDRTISGRALALAGAALDVEGGAAESARGRAMIAEALRQGQGEGDRTLAGLALCAAGFGALAAGRYREAMARADDAHRIAEAAGGSAIWERHYHRSVGGQALLGFGLIRERSRRAEVWLADARAKGDRLGEAEASISIALARLASGDPPAARRLARAALERVSQRAFTPLHELALRLEVGSLLYEGDPAGAWARLVSAEPALRASLLLRLQNLRVEQLLLRGVTAAALAAAEPSEAPPHLAEATSAAAALARERRPHALAGAAVVRGAAAWARGEAAAAATQLGVAAAGYEACEMKLHAACASRAAGALRRDSAAIARADARLAEEGVVAPARWTAMFTGVSA